MRAKDASIQMKIGYGRVSKLDQNPDLQIAALREAGCEKIFIEKISSRKERRPEWERVNEMLRSGDTLTVWKLDRMARSLSELITISAKLQKTGIHLEIVTNKLDTSTPAGRMVYGMLAVVAEFERDLIQERTRAGIAAAREQGRLAGRPRKLKPADLSKAQALMQDPAISMKEIANTLGVSVPVLYRAFPGGRRFNETKI